MTESVRCGDEDDATHGHGHEGGHDKEDEHGHGHEHEHGHGHSHDYRAVGKRRLAIVIALTGAMMVVEFVGGVWTNSLALISDAGHMLTHFFALTLSYFAIVVACRPATGTSSFGHHRAEVIAALVNGITLIAITAVIIYEAWQRFLHPLQIAEFQMLLIAVLGLLVNLMSAAVLSGSFKDDLNVRSAFYHMLGDTLSSVAVIVGAIAIYYTKITVIDPLLSVLLCVVILVWSGKLLSDSIRILMEYTPRHIDVDTLTREVLSDVRGVRDLDHIHVWEITSGMYAMTARVIVVDCPVSRTQEIASEIKSHVRKKYRIGHVNLEFVCSGGDAVEKTNGPGGI